MARRWHYLTHYHPMPLHVVENWADSVVSGASSRGGRSGRHDDTAAARQALSALGMTGLSHMEWFRRADGSVAISEVGARLLGAQITTLVSWRTHIDFVRVLDAGDGVRYV
ncbi:MAG: hypothetical protein U0163_13850 [Gemmatimonadaceae bacterium]